MFANLKPTYFPQNIEHIPVTDNKHSVNQFHVSIFSAYKSINIDKHHRLSCLVKQRSTSGVKVKEKWGYHCCLQQSQPFNTRSHLQCTRLLYKYFCCMLLRSEFKTYNGDIISDSTRNLKAENNKKWRSFTWLFKPMKMHL